MAPAVERAAGSASGPPDAGRGRGPAPASPLRRGAGIPATPETAPTRHPRAWAARRPSARPRSAGRAATPESRGVLEGTAHQPPLHAAAVVGEQPHSEAGELGHRDEPFPTTAKVMAPATAIRPVPSRRAPARRRATAAESIAGSVLGMATTAVYPPRAAALEPVSTVSAIRHRARGGGCAGRRARAQDSTSGVEDRRSLRAPARHRLRLSVRSHEDVTTASPARSTSVPPRTTISPMCVVRSGAPSDDPRSEQVEQDGHAARCLAHLALSREERRLGHFRRVSSAADHRPGCMNEGLFPQGVGPRPLS